MVDQETDESRRRQQTTSTNKKALSTEGLFVVLSKIYWDNHDSVSKNCAPRATRFNSTI